VEQVSDTGTTVSLMQAENSVSTSEMSLSDMKENMENQIVNLYNTIKSLETSIENNKKQLSDLNKNLEIAKLKYDIGSISEIELLQAENQVAEMENTIIEQIYQHSQNIKQFENVNLL
ncbi:MAG TPA: TolC family protein, partial [Candidatus Fimicola cottocaccae]|nr:TolC family protein [Candidatus Fimicola cottocaccae]